MSGRQMRFCVPSMKQQTFPKYPSFTSGCNFALIALYLEVRRKSEWSEWGDGERCTWRTESSGEGEQREWCQRGRTEEGVVWWGVEQGVGGEQVSPHPPRTPMLKL